VWFPSCKNDTLLSDQSEEREKLAFISQGRNLFDGHAPKARVPYLEKELLSAEFLSEKQICLSS